MNRKRRIFILICLIALVVFVTGFILSNSLMDYEDSHNSSGVITDIVNPTDDVVERDQTDFIIRKLAHIIEFAALGVAVALLMLFALRAYRLKLFGYGCCYSLLVAVVDEHIQSFSDRASSTSDILLDFLGSIVGICSVLIVFYIICFALKKIRERSIS